MVCWADVGVCCNGAGHVAASSHIRPKHTNFPAPAYAPRFCFSLRPARGVVWRVAKPGRHESLGRDTFGHLGLAKVVTPGGIPFGSRGGSLRGRYPGCMETPERAHPYRPAASSPSARRTFTGANGGFSFPTASLPCSRGLAVTEAAPLCVAPAVTDKRSRDGPQRRGAPKWRPRSPATPDTGPSHATNVSRLHSRTGKAHTGYDKPGARGLLFSKPRRNTGFFEKLIPAFAAIIVTTASGSAWRSSHAGFFRFLAGPEDGQSN